MILHVFMAHGAEQNSRTHKQFKQSKRINISRTNTINQFNSMCCVFAQSMRNLIMNEFLRILLKLLELGSCAACGKRAVSRFWRFCIMTEYNNFRQKAKFKGKRI